MGNGESIQELRKVLQQSLAAFSELSLSNSDSESLPAEIDDAWCACVDASERFEVARYIHGGRTQKAAERLVERGWVRVDSENERVVYMSKWPANTSPVVSCVGVIEEGVWQPPRYLDALVYFHSDFRRLGGSARFNGQREKILQLVRMSKAQGGDGEFHGFDHVGAADHLDYLISDPERISGEDGAWLVEARQSLVFWEIIESAIHFGMTLKSWDVFGDGTIEELIERGLAINPGKATSDKGKVVEAIIRDYRCYHQDAPTPGRLLKWIKAQRQVYDGDDLMVGKEEWKKQLGSTSYVSFVNLVKAARKRMEL